MAIDVAVYIAGADLGTLLGAVRNERLPLAATARKWHAHDTDQILLHDPPTAPARCLSSCAPALPQACFPCSCKRSIVL